MGVAADVRARPQPRIGADDRPRAHDRALQVAEGPDHRAALDLHTGGEDHERLDHRVGPDLGIPGQHDRLRRAHLHAVVHQPGAAAALEGGLGGGEFGLAVDALHPVFVGEHRPHLELPTPGDGDHVGQVVFPLGVGGADLGEQAEQQAGGGGQHAGIAAADLQHRRVRFRGLDDPQQAAVGVDHQPAVGGRVGGLEAQHHQVGALTAGFEHRLDPLGVQERRVGVGHHHVAVEAGQRLFRRLHRVAGPERRVLDRHRLGAQPGRNVLGHPG